MALLSVTADCAVHEMHIGRIQGFFSQTGLSSQALKRALKDISALREAEHLGKGYWLPTPTRTIALDDDTSLLVSIAPTTELQRHFSSVRRAGLGRLVATAHVSHLPSQSLKSWCGTGDLDTETWAQTLITSVTNDFHPSIAPADLEAFSVKSTRQVTQSPHHKPAWIRFTDRRVPAWNGVNLFRSRLGPNNYRYFLGKLTSSRVLLEGPPVVDNLSLQYGLASLLGKPLTVSTRSQVNSICIMLPLIAPRSVRCLLSALCKQNPKRFGYDWLCCQTECWPIVMSALQNLGCEIINHE